MSGARREASSLAIPVIGFGAAIATAWLGRLVVNQAAIRGDHWAGFDERDLSSLVRRGEKAVSLVAYPAVCFPLAFVIAADCRRRGLDGGRAVPLAAALGWLGHRGVKLFLHRRRPRSQRAESNYRRAYPSGHTTAATSIATATAYVLWRGHQPMRRVMLVALLPPVLVGASRVVLGKHWPTDVIGGWTTGVAAACGASLLARRRPFSRRQQRESAASAFLPRIVGEHR